MKNLTGTQFAIYIAVVTMGFAAALPAIPWLRPLGVLLVVGATAAVRGQQYLRRHGEVFIGMALMVLAVVLAAIAPQTAARSYRPHAWYALTLVLGWAVGVVIEYCRWRSRYRKEKQSA